MVALRIAAERTEAVVAGRTAASVRVECTGWTGTVPPIVSVAAEQAGVAYPWVSIEASSARGSTSAVVTFDPTRDRRPGPDTYPVVVSVETGGQRASTTVRFVVERHPCLRISPQPSFTWDPLTNSATLKVGLARCGNVDIDVSWSAQLNGRHLEVEPATMTVFADGGPADAILTIKIPEGVDLDTKIDIESVSELGVERSTAVAAVPQRSWVRRHGVHLLVAATAAITVLAAPVVASLDDDDPPSDTTEADVTTTGAVTSTTTPPVTEVVSTTDAPTGVPANHNPTATADEQTDIEDATTTIDVLANDRDDDGDGLDLISVVDEPRNGTAQVVDDAIEYTPAPDFAGTDTFSYALGDGRGGLAEGFVTVLIEGQPDAPVAVDDAFTVLEGQVWTLDVLANDTDADGDELAIIDITQPDNGKSDQVDDRTLRYFAGEGSTSDQLTYVATDGVLESEPATVEITILPSLDVVVDQTVHELTGVSIDPITVRLSSPARSVIRGTYRTVDDGALRGFDYDGDTGSFEFNVGERTIELDDIGILRDSVEENDETFDIELTVEHPGGLVDRATITVTINDATVTTTTTEFSEP